MQFRTVAAVAVALLVITSGCSALGGSQADDPSNETETDSDELANADDEADANESAAEDGAATDNGSDADADDPGSEGGNESENETQTEPEDDTADAAWYPPEEPNRPLEDKREDRIESVEFVDKEPAADGEGYSNFNLEVVANTSMKNVDPPEHGNVIGEPYFFVKINEGPGNRKIIERTGHVRMAENGTFHIDVRPAGIEEFGDGPLTVEVFLMDEDKDWDDIYDSVGTKIHFNPDADSEQNADGDDSKTNDSETNET
ncbi:hypothetical protein [Halosolutus gelatinilyticus]|uniref:hypothetical protein n=1 Tax=Halosolutus gelatinilyticus TaxID=2931975 RepID=UPI001FF20D50|nr:hypothetical protein [Halosolutus gelatinilyticus]